MSEFDPVIYVWLGGAALLILVIIGVFAAASYVEWRVKILKSAYERWCGTCGKGTQHLHGKCIDCTKNTLQVPCDHKVFREDCDHCRWMENAW